MRMVVSDALVKEFHSRGEDEDVPLIFSDSLTTLIHCELTRPNDSRNPKTKINEFADLLEDDLCEEETIHEYVLLKKHFRSSDNIFTRTMLLRGLHHHPRNRAWINSEDASSVEQNAALLEAVILTRKRSRGERTLNTMLAYYSYDDKGYYGQSIREEETANLIMDYPQHVETLIDLIMARGYRNSLPLFREMMSNGVSALNEGVI